MVDHTDSVVASVQRILEKKGIRWFKVQPDDILDLFDMDHVHPTSRPRPPAPRGPETVWNYMLQPSSLNSSLQNCLPTDHRKARYLPP